MHIQSATIHIAHLTLTSAQQLEALAGPMILGEAINRLPLIGQPWQGQGGIYIGMQPSEDMARNEHVILATEEPDGLLNNADGIEWAKGLDIEGHRDFQMFDTREGALLYANLKHLFDQSKTYWTRTQYSALNAFYQYFDHGNQYSTGKKAELRVRAVRRFAA